MPRVSVLRRFTPWLRNIRRSLEAPDSLLSDKSCRIISQASHSAPWSPPLGLPAAVESTGRPPVVSGRRIDNAALSLRRFSTINDRDDSALEEEVERKAGWLLKAIFIITAFGVASQFFPYMGDNLLQQSISLLHVKDPLFKRMGASRLRRFAIDDERRVRVAEMGGAQDLLIMLESAKDDKTRKEALKALLALSHSDAVAEILQQANAAAIVASAPDSTEFDEIGNCKSSLLKRFREMENNQSPSEVSLG